MFKFTSRKSRHQAQIEFDKVKFDPAKQEECVKLLYSTSLERMATEANWYHGQAVRRRWFSFLIRGIAVIAIAISMIALDYAAFFPRPVGQEMLPAGVATLSLVVAGVALLFDRVFIITNNMTRYRVSQYAIEKLKTVFASDFQKNVFANMPHTQKSFYEAKAMALEAMEGVFDVISQEVAQWKDDTENAVDALRQNVDKRLEQTKTQFDAARVAAEKRAEDELPGNINVSIEKKTNVQRPDTVKISLSGPVTASANAQIGSSLGFSNVSPGNYKISASDAKIQTDAPEFASKAVKLESGETLDVSL